MTGQIDIQKIEVTQMRVPIVGKTPLIVNNFSEKSKRQMLEAMQGRKSAKVARDPQADYQAAFYRIANEDGPDKCGVPAVAFKKCTIGAARFYKNVKMTELKQAFFVRGKITKADPQMLVEIIGEPEMREDVVRTAGLGHNADLRYRPVFNEWSATLNVEFVHSMLSQDSILSLIDAGGLGVGVCEWRPERGGDFGRFEVDTTKEILYV